MDSLKALLAKKKAEKLELVGDKKFVRRGDLEEARLKRIREEEEQERRDKEKRRKQHHGGGPGSGASAAGAASGDAGSTDAAAAAAAQQQQQQAEADLAVLKALLALSRAEVFRRLRALKQPVTLFGEESDQRVKRLARIEKESALIDDEARYGGQQENTLLAIQREGKRKKKGLVGDGDAAADGAGGTGGDKARAADKAADKVRAAAADRSGQGHAGGRAEGPALGKGEQGGAEGPAAPKGEDGAGEAAGGGGANGGSQGGSSGLEDAFAAAAARLAEQRAEEAMDIEERIAKYLRQWCNDWGDDLEARPDEAKASGPGHQATMVYKQSMRFMEPLWKSLDTKTLDDELKVGLWMMVQYMRDRNYLAANDVYLKLAIGNSPWPIGVTSVGIHERSAREKISHVMNASGKAHIMNDEATRKYFQAIKRLMSNLQRLYPTDPSRSIDFNLTAGEGRGAAGGGSQKAALLEAEQRGEDWRRLGLPAAPHHMAPDGSVAIPPKWENVLNREMRKAGVLDAGGSVDEGGGGGAPRTPPRPKTPASGPVTPPGACK